MEISKLDRNFIATEAADGLDWYDIRQFGVEGQGWKETDAPFSRFPSHAKPHVRDYAWELSKNSAGLCVRFVTDVGKVSAKWTLLSETLAMAHMPATGVSGLDLYARDRGSFRFVGIGIPSKKENSSTLCNLPAGEREYCLYLPLYNGVSDVKIGVPSGSVIKPAPAWPGYSTSKKPVVVYGTSIVQGGCACRPGMAYPAIISRMLDRSVINLGFSGNGPMYASIAPIIAEIDASVFVIDSLPNMSAETVTSETYGFIRKLRELRPETPIVVVEAFPNTKWLSSQKATAPDVRNVALRIEYARLLADGVKGLSYIPGEYLVGDDDEGTVDGVHPTDLGFLRMAEVIAPVVKNLG